MAEDRREIARLKGMLRDVQSDYDEYVVLSTEVEHGLASELTAAREEVEKEKKLVLLIEGDLLYNNRRGTEFELELIEQLSAVKAELGLEKAAAQKKEEEHRAVLTSALEAGNVARHKLEIFLEEKAASAQRIEDTKIKELQARVRDLEADLAARPAAAPAANATSPVATAPAGATSPAPAATAHAPGTAAAVCAATAPASAVASAPAATLPAGSTAHAPAPAPGAASSASAEVTSSAARTAASRGRRSAGGGARNACNAEAAAAKASRATAASEWSPDSMVAERSQPKGGVDTMPSPKSGVAVAWDLEGPVSAGVETAVGMSRDGGPCREGEGDLAKLLRRRAPGFVERSQAREKELRQRREAREEARVKAATEAKAAAAAKVAEAAAIPSPEPCEARSSPPNEKGRRKKEGLTVRGRSDGAGFGKSFSDSAEGGGGRRKVSMKEARQRTARLYNRLPEVIKQRGAEERNKERIRRLLKARESERQRSRLERERRRGGGGGGGRSGSGIGDGT